MATEFLMPKLGLTMEQGTILSWLVPNGTEVYAGMPVLAIETDKVESDVEASAAGRLHQLGEEGQTFSCGAVIGLLLAEGEQPPSAPHNAAATVSTGSAIATVASPSTGISANVTSTIGGANGRRFVSPNARRVAALSNVDLASVEGSGPGGRVVSEDVEEAARRPRPAASIAASQPALLAQSSAAASGRVSQPATAAARQLADLLGVDLAVVAPDPVDGYVTRESVARYVRARLQPPPATTAMQTPSSTKRMAGMRGTIAKRMHASLHEMAQLTLNMDASMDAVVVDRRERAANGAAPSFTDYVIAAAARALRIHPALNAQVTPEGIALLPDVHVGLAVALDEGLMVPVVRNTDRLDLDSLSRETTRLAHAVRDGSITLAELEGGTFSVTALGMFGVDAFTPIINPPNVAILGVGRIRDDLTLVDGVVTTTKRLTLSLTWDHRVIDGAPAAAFCSSIVELLSLPSQLD